MIRLSLCMIVKNEEKDLARCLESVKGLVDEMIIVDTDSSDGTKEIAKSFGAKVFDFEWCDDFSAARNESLKHATGDWILVLDADEVIDEESKGKIREMVESTGEEVIGLVLQQRNYMNLEEGENNPLGWVSQKNDFSEGYFDTPVVRLFRNVEGVFYKGVVHECASGFLKEKGRIVISDVLIPHFGKLNQGSRKKKGEMYEKLGKKKLEKEKDYYSYYELARQCLGNKKIDEAVDLLRKSIELNNKFWQSWFNLGSIYFMNGDLEEAENHLERANELKPGNPSVLGNLGAVYAQKKDFSKAKEILEKAVEADLNHALNLFNLAKVYKELGDEEMFRLTFSRAAELNPEYRKFIKKK